MMSVIYCDECTKYINPGITYRNTKMLLVEVHELHLIVRDLLLVWRLKYEGNCVSVVLGFHSNDVVIASALHDLRHTANCINEW